MGQNKTSRYLKYAIGEIILVVIGILIALQINNWNEEKKDKTELKNILEQIVADIKQDSTDLQLVYKDVEVKDSIALQLSYFLQGYYTQLDSTQLGIAVLEAHTVDEFTANDASYQTLVSTGAINRIKDSDLKKLLTDYYTEDKWDLAIQSQRDNYAFDYGLIRFNHINDRSLREHLKYKLKVKTYSKEYAKNIVKDWNKIKNDNDYIIQLNKVLALNIAYLNTLSEYSKIQEILIEELTKLIIKQ